MRPVDIKTRKVGPGRYVAWVVGSCERVYAETAEKAKTNCKLLYKKNGEQPEWVKFSWLEGPDDVLAATIAGHRVIIRKNPSGYLAVVDTAILAQQLFTREDAMEAVFRFLHIVGPRVQAIQSMEFSCHSISKHADNKDERASLE